MEWTYKNEKFGEELAAGYTAFVYLITDLLNNKKYIGKKTFTFTGYKQVKGKRKRIKKASDWDSYYGSNQELSDRVIEHGEQNFKREILHLCKSKTEATYLELREQMDNRVLESDDFYNQWIMAKVRKSNLKDLNGR